MSIEDARNDAGACKELLNDALPGITSAILAVEGFPETMRSEEESDLRWKALRAMYQVFWKVYRAEFYAHRAYCSCAPFELRSIPDDDIGV